MRAADVPVAPRPVGSGRRTTILSLVLASVFVASVCGAADVAKVSRPAATAEIGGGQGRVEILKKGTRDWNVAAEGAVLDAEDHVRTTAGAWSELRLPDGSALLIAENSQVSITKLEYEAETRERNLGFHVMVGKVTIRVIRLSEGARPSSRSTVLVSSPAGFLSIKESPLVGDTTVAILIFNPRTQATYATVVSPVSAGATFVSRFSGKMSTITTGQSLLDTVSRAASRPAEADKSTEAP